MTTSNNSKIFLRLLWFILLKYSPTTVIYLPWHQHQSRNHVLKKSLCLFTNILDVKKETASHLVGAAKYKRKTIKYVTIPWSLKKKAKIRFKNWWAEKEVSLQLDYASSTSCEIANSKWLSEGENWWSHWTATGSKIFTEGVCQITS